MALRSPVPSSTMSATIAARPSLSNGSAPDPPSTCSTNVMTGTLACSTRPHVQAVGQAVPHDLGKGKRRIRPDVGKPRPVDAGHDTETGSEPASASAG